MIRLTVKTLDSQNHPFTLQEDMTVREFKEHIAESVNISADSQRLIYCGRVLQDDKKLNDYDVNGKVIHLVQRAPPQATQRGQSTSQEQRSGSSSSQRNFRPRAQIHGNTMYLGSMSIPPEVIEGHGFGQPTPLLSQTLSARRLVVAFRMLRRANEVIDRMDNPSLPNNPSPDPPLSPMPQQIQIQTVDYTGTSVSNPLPRVMNNERMAEAVSAVFNAAGLNNVTVFRDGMNNDDDTEASENTTDNNQSTASTVEQTQEQHPSRAQPQQSQSDQQQSEQQSTPQSETSTNGRRRFARVSRLLPRLTEMADILDRYMQTQDRMRPYIVRYRDLMRADPPRVSGRGPNTTEDQQQIVDGVSEALHYMSHACHSLSDIVVNMDHAPPRFLRCHPMIVQHSAIVQAGIPIQVEAHINLPDRNAQSANNNNENNETEQSNAQSTPRAAAATTAASGTSTDENARRPDTPNVSQQPYINFSPSPFSSFFTLPNNVEVLMEVSPEAAMDSNSGEEQPQNNGATNNNVNHRVGGARITAGTFPWTNTPDFLQSLMHAVAGHVVQSGVAGIPNVNFQSDASGQQTTASDSLSSSSGSGQSVQARSQMRRMRLNYRSNLETHSTNSVLTRTTPRPQVFHPQAHPVGISGIGMNMDQHTDFDPFLNCTSHHFRRRQHGPSTNASNNTSSASSQTNQSNPATTSTTENQTQTLRQSAAPTSTAFDTSNEGPILNNVGIQDLQEALASRYPCGSLIEEAMANILQILIDFQTNAARPGNSENSNLRGVTLAQILQENDLRLRSNMGLSFIGDIGIIIASNLTLGELFDIRLGNWTSIGRLREPLREFFRTAFPHVFEVSLVYNATNRFIEELRDHLEDLFQAEEVSQSRINLVETMLNIIKTGILRILNIIFQFDSNNTSTHDAFNADIQQTVSTVGENLIAVVRHSFPGGQSNLNTVVTRIANNYFLERTSIAVTSALVPILVNLLLDFSSSIAQPPYSEIVPLLVYRREQVSTSQKNTESEPMDVEPINDKVDDKVNDKALENNEMKSEDIPRTFSGHEVLPPDWVPVIARDSVAQCCDVNGGTLTPFSDAYLGGLPSKRRKLIESQKPRVLVSPPPNSTPIAASLERLVKDGTNRAGLDEVEGAAAAVASDPGVRSAFGQAIKDCLKPKKQSPDFPDAKRFPNATKFFSDDDRAKQ